MVPRPMRASLSLTEERQQCSGSHHQQTQSSDLFPCSVLLLPQPLLNEVEGKRLWTSGLFASKGKIRRVTPGRWAFILCRSGQERFSEDLNGHLRQSLARSWWLLQPFYMSVRSFQFGEYRILSNGVSRGRFQEPNCCCFVFLVLKDVSL